MRAVGGRTIARPGSLSEPLGNAAVTRARPGAMLAVGQSSVLASCRRLPRSRGSLRRRRSATLRTRLRFGRPALLLVHRNTPPRLLSSFGGGNATVMRTRPAAGLGRRPVLALYFGGLLRARRSSTLRRRGCFADFVLSRGPRSNTAVVRACTAACLRGSPVLALDLRLVLRRLALCLRRNGNERQTGNRYDRVAQHGRHRHLSPERCPAHLALASHDPGRVPLLGGTPSCP
jgi:hypothetical protein